jgi:hypothetical protein
MALNVGLDASCDNMQDLEGTRKNGGKIKGTEAYITNYGFPVDATLGCGYVNFRGTERREASVVTSAVLGPKLSQSWQRCQRSPSLHHWLIIAFIFVQDRSSGWDAYLTNLNFLTQTDTQTDRQT